MKEIRTLYYQENEPTGIHKDYDVWIERCINGFIFNFYCAGTWQRSMAIDNISEVIKCLKGNYYRFSDYQYTQYPENQIDILDLANKG